MIGWPYQLHGHEFEQTSGDGEGQGSLACCSPWGCRVGRELATEQQLKIKTFDERIKRWPPSHLYITDCKYSDDSLFSFVLSH